MMIDDPNRHDTMAASRRPRLRMALLICAAVATAPWLLAGVDGATAATWPQKVIDAMPSGPWRDGHGQARHDDDRLPVDGVASSARHTRMRADRQALKRKENEAHASLRSYFLHARALPEYCRDVAGVDIGAFVAAYESIYRARIASARETVSKGYYVPESGYLHMKELYMREVTLDMNDLAEASGLSPIEICMAHQRHPGMLAESYGPPLARSGIGESRRD